MINKKDIGKTLEDHQLALEEHNTSLSAHNDTLLVHGNTLLRLHTSFSESIGVLLERINSDEKQLSTIIVALNEQLKILREEMELVSLKD
jgi:hypothetical protein